ncbi:MAG: GntR family transcriptional regulator [Treponema sp.]|nr:GntR family transcriptional regulator [Treponema sp.]
MEKIDSNRMLPIRDVIYQRIRRDVLHGKLRPGERLMEEQLASELGTSRTPVREALRKLEVEKLVHHHPHRGVIISEVFAGELEDLYELREHIEGIIAKHAARNATSEDIDLLNSLMDKMEAGATPDEAADSNEQFNHTLSQISACPTIIEIARQLRETLGRIMASTYLTPKRTRFAQTEHRAIVAAIAKGNSDLAQKLTVQHVRNAAEELKNMERRQE